MGNNDYNVKGTKGLNAKGNVIPTNARVDYITDGIITIDNNEEGIHRGYAYTLNQDWGSVANGAVNNIAIETPENIWMHIKVIEPLTTVDYIELQAQINATISGGSEIQAINRNMHDGITNQDSTITEGVSIDTAGDNIYNPSSLKIYGTSANQGQQRAGLRKSDLDIIIPPETNIVFTLTNSSGGEADFVGLSLIFYEASEGYTGDKINTVED